MSNQTQRLKFTQLAASIALVAGGAAFVPAANAAAPTAGTSISNVASASYTDSTGNSKTVTSNLVTTTVLQVASFTLVSDQTKTANANGQVSLSHTLTNTGNGSDTFALAVAQDDTRDGSADTYNFSGLVVYLDANKDGVPDSQTSLTSVTLAAGESVNVIVQATTPSAVAIAAAGKLTVSATSSLGNSGASPATTGSSINKVTATDKGDAVRWNVDTVTITQGAVISLTKSASVTAIDATQASTTAREVEYKLVYQNTGNSTATNVTVTDVLPAGLTYVAGSAKLAGVAQTDAVGDDSYQFDGAVAQGTVTLTIPSLAPNTTGVLTFKVIVAKDTAAGVITNIANVDPDGPGSEGNTPSNPNDVTVLGIKKGTINDREGNVSDSAYADADKTTALDKDNQIIIADVKQGQEAVFGGATGEKIVIHNTGNVAEEFNVAVDKGNLPAGSIISLYQADGVTPFVSTGLIPSNGSYNLIAKITLPANHADSVVRTTTLITSPKSDSSKTDTLNLVITKVTPATVDLHNGDATNSTGSVSGASGKDTGQFVDTKSVLPGQVANFPLQIDNEGVTGDNFNLTHNLPAGWDVKFYAANGTNPTGAPLTNTGNINGSSNIKLIAVVTPPAGATAGDHEVIFTVTSSATGLTDKMSDKVTVQADRKLSLQNDRIGQVAPGGTIVYKHILTNNSNLVEGAAAGTLPFTLINDKAGNGWVTSLYIDVNNDGNIDVADTLVTGTDLSAYVGSGINKGASVNFLIKVQAPANATAGTPSSVIFTISPTAIKVNPTDLNSITHTAITNTDLTTVTEGQVRLVKDQALVDCSTGTGTYTQNTVSAKPGECVKYRITATNEGNATVTNVVISDNTPSYTTLKAIANVSPKVSANAALSGTSITTDGTTGKVEAEMKETTVGDGKNILAPNATASLEFVIKVNN